MSKLTHLFVAIAIVVCLAQSTTATSSLARGFNDKIAWMTLEQGQAAARSTGKPLMILLHKTWCGKRSTCSGCFILNERLTGITCGCRFPC